jgi:MscS family membrane protein
MSNCCAACSRPEARLVRKLVRAFLLLLALGAAAPLAAAPLNPGYDPTNPATAYRSFMAEAERIGRLNNDYLAAPSFPASFALGRAAVRLGLEAFDLSDVPIAERPRVGATAAVMLADILIRLPEPTEAQFGRAAGPDPPARWTIPGTEIHIRRIAEGERSGDYVFSGATLSRMAEFHAAIMAEPPLRAAPVTDWLEAQRRFTGPLLAWLPVDDLPAPLRATIGGTPAWKAALALLALLLVLVLLHVWNRIALRRAEAAHSWRQRAWLLTRPLALALLLLVGQTATATQLNPGGLVGEAGLLLVGFLLVVAAAWAAWHLCWLVAEALIASPRIPDETYDAHLVRLVARVASLLAVAAILVYGANLFGVPALGLLAGVSIGGIALALAAQNTVENLLGGISIFADRPFRVGDAIRYGAVSGTVEAIGPRSSRIRGPDGSLTTVPNSDLAKMQVTNLSLRDRFAFAHRFALPVGVTSAQLAALMAALRDRLAALPVLADAPSPPRVTLVPLDGTGAALEVTAALGVTSQPAFEQAQEAVFLEVMRTLEEA